MHRTKRNSAGYQHAVIRGHRTRVSEMRSSLSRLNRELIIADSCSGTSSLQRRNQGLLTHSSG